MRIGIMGAGAVGGYYGAKLIHSQADVTFLVRENRKKQIEQHGLIVKSTSGHYALKPRCVTDVTQGGPYDVVIVAFKNYHLTDAMEDLRTLVEQGAIILPLLNGVMHMDHLIAQLGANHVLGGSCYIETTLGSEGEVLQTGGTCEIVFGMTKEGMHDPHSKDVVNHLQDLFVKAGVPVRHHSSIRTEMWKKYIFLCALSGMTAACRLPLGRIMADSKARLTYHAMLRELVTVARAKGMEIPLDFADKTIERSAAIDPMLTSSMHRDLEKGLPIEVDSLQGALIEMAQHVNIPVPVHETIYAVLSGHKQGKRTVSHYV
nr:2-dehydropantoate 2-reductase [Bacilli bacterium]